MANPTKDPKHHHKPPLPPNDSNSSSPKSTLKAAGTISSSSNTSDSSPDTKKAVTWADLEDPASSVITSSGELTSSDELTSSVTPTASSDTLTASTTTSSVDPITVDDVSKPVLKNADSITSGSESPASSDANATSGGQESSVRTFVPKGNIVPSGIIKTGMKYKKVESKIVPYGEVSNYGFGNIFPGPKRPPGESSNPDIVRKAANEEFRKGRFDEAVKLYDSVVKLTPREAGVRSNRAAALAAVGRMAEAVKDCEVALRISPYYGRAHLRLASVFLRLGHVEYAKKHLYASDDLADSTEFNKLEILTKHVKECQRARLIEDWNRALKECDAAIEAVADSSPLLTALKAECLFRLCRLDEAESELAKAINLDSLSPCCPESKFLGMLSNSYLYIVKSHIEMAQGRFEEAVAAAEKAKELDPLNADIEEIISKLRAVEKAQARGNEFFNVGQFEEALLSYKEGIKLDPVNPALYGNRAACFLKLGVWNLSVDECNEALRLQPNYSKALLYRAASYAKLEKWLEAVEDYEVLRKKFPLDRSIAEDMFHAKVGLRVSLGEDVTNMKFGGEVERINNVEQLMSAIATTGLTVLLFARRNSKQCDLISKLLDDLCAKYPMLNFLKVDVNKSKEISKAESIIATPTVKFYRNGAKIKEIICPCKDVFERAVEEYKV